VQGVEEVEAPLGEGQKALVRGVVAGQAGAVTVLSPEALFQAAVQLFGER
jgi:hypothetical protein